MAIVCRYCGRDVEIDEKGMPVGCVNEKCEMYRPKKESVTDVRVRDNKTKPKHYHGTMIIDFIEDMNLGFSLGNVVKYVARCGKKKGESELEDLRKARFYLQYHIDRLEREMVSRDVDEIVDKAFEGKEKALNKDKRYDLEWDVRTCSCGHSTPYPKVSGTQSLRCPKCGELNRYVQLYGETEPMDLHYEKGEWSGFKCSCGKKVTIGKDRRLGCDCGTFVFLTEKKKETSNL